MEAVRRLNARWLALLAATAIVLYLCWLMLAPFVDVLMWGVVFAMVSWPVFQRLRRRGYSAHVGSIITTALVVLTIMIPLTLVTGAVIKQGADAMHGVQSGLQHLLDPNSRLFKTLDPYVDLDPFRDPKVLGAKVAAVWGLVANRTLGLVGGFVGGLVQVFFVLFTLYYLLRDSEQILPAVRDCLPLSRGQTDKIFERTGEVISASVKGVLVIAAIQGFLGMIAFWVLGLPSPLLWGVVMFLLSTIPMVGSAVIWVPAALFLASTDHWIKAGLLAAWGAFVIGLIDNVLRPRLVGKRAKLHELIIFFSVLGGLQVFGILGLFVGPVVAAIALALVEVFKQTGEAQADNQSATASATMTTPEMVISEAPQTPVATAAVGLRPLPDKTA